MIVEDVVPEESKVQKRKPSGAVLLAMHDDESEADAAQHRPSDLAAEEHANAHSQVLSASALRSTTAQLLSTLPAHADAESSSAVPPPPPPSAAALPALASASSLGPGRPPPTPVSGHVTADTPKSSKLPVTPKKLLPGLLELMAGKNQKPRRPSTIACPPQEELVLKKEKPQPFPAAKQIPATSLLPRIGPLRDMLARQEMMRKQHDHQRRVKHQQAALERKKREEEEDFQSGDNLEKRQAAVMDAIYFMTEDQAMVNEAKAREQAAKERQTRRLSLHSISVSAKARHLGEEPSPPKPAYTTLPKKVTSRSLAFACGCECRGGFYS